MVPYRTVERFHIAHSGVETKWESFFLPVGKSTAFFVGDLFWRDATGKSGNQHGHFNLPISVSASINNHAKNIGKNWKIYMHLSLLIQCVKKILV